MDRGPNPVDFVQPILPWHLSVRLICRLAQSRSPVDSTSPPAFPLRFPLRDHIHNECPRRRDGEYQRGRVPRPPRHVPAQFSPFVMLLMLDGRSESDTPTASPRIRENLRKSPLASCQLHSSSVHQATPSPSGNRKCLKRLQSSNTTPSNYTVASGSAGTKATAAPSLVIIFNFQSPALLPR